ncbi:Uncharacterised protein [Vibrio cholerae]|nr:Uncharacterised protein [Vibrio cholerae]
MSVYYIYLYSILRQVSPSMRMPIRRCAKIWKPILTTLLLKGRLIIGTLMRAMMICPRTSSLHYLDVASAFPFNKAG